MQVNFGNRFGSSSTGEDSHSSIDDNVRDVVSSVNDGIDSKSSNSEYLWPIDDNPSIENLFSDTPMPSPRRMHSTDELSDSSLNIDRETESSKKLAPVAIRELPPLGKPFPQKRKVHMNMKEKNDKPAKLNRSLTVLDLSENSFTGGSEKDDVNSIFTENTDHTLPLESSSVAAPTADQQLGSVGIASETKKRKVAENNNSAKLEGTITGSDSSADEVSSINTSMDSESVSTEASSEWRKCFSKREQRHYWYNSKTKQSVWNQPK